MSDLTQRLRKGETYHQQVSRDHEPYETVERHKPAPRIQLEAADRIEALEIECKTLRHGLRLADTKVIALEQDSARYRWLRDQACSSEVEHLFWMDSVDDMEAAIDAAMQGSKE